MQTSNTGKHPRISIDELLDGTPISKNTITKSNISLEAQTYLPTHYLDHLEWTRVKKTIKMLQSSHQRGLRQSIQLPRTKTKQPLRHGQKHNQYTVIHKRMESQVIEH